MKKLIKENIHIDVDPALGFNHSEEGIIKICKGIKEQILRHIDDVAQVSIAWEGRSICSFCGYDWEINEEPNDLDYELGEPLCCEKAQDEWRKLKK